MRFERNVIALLTAAALAACGGGDAGANQAAGGQSAAADPAPAAAPAASSMEQQGPLPAGVTAQMVTAGKQIFSGQGICYTCHGPDGTGTQLAPDLTDSEWQHFDKKPSLDQVVQLVMTGVPNPISHPAPMPPKGGANLSDEQVRDVAAYILTLSPTPSSN